MAADALTHARDVLRMVAIGIQQHAIQARDVEFLYDDGPKRVSVHRLAVEAMRGLEKEIAARTSGVTEPHRCRWLNGRCMDCGRAYGEPRAAGVTACKAGGDWRKCREDLPCWKAQQCCLPSGVAGTLKENDRG